MMLIAFLASATLISCEKKSDVSVEEVDLKASIPDYDKMVKYISITTGVSIQDVKFDSSKKEFFIAGKSFRGSLEQIQNFYNTANEYKSTFESN